MPDDDVLEQTPSLTEQLSNNPPATDPAIMLNPSGERTPPKPIKTGRRSTDKDEAPLNITIIPPETL